MSISYGMEVKTKRKEKHRTDKNVYFVPKLKPKFMKIINYLKNGHIVAADRAVP